MSCFIAVGILGNFSMTAKQLPAFASKSSLLLFGAKGNNDRNPEFIPQSMIG